MLQVDLGGVVGRVVRSTHADDSCDGAALVHIIQNAETAAQQGHDEHVCDQFAIYGSSVRC